jgi:hypothetical protein
MGTKGLHRNGLLIMAGCIVGMLAAGQVSAQGQVVMTGYILSTANSGSMPTAEIVAMDGETMPLAIKNNGKFWVCAPATETYILRFAQEGAAPKEVVVDAVQGCPNGTCKDRSLKFDVLLEAAKEKNTAAAGRIDLNSSTGKVHVRKHEGTVKTRKPLALGVVGDE